MELFGGAHAVPLADGLAAGGLAILAVLLGILGWKGEDRPARHLLASCATAALVLASSRALAALGAQPPGLAWLAGHGWLAATLTLLAGLPGWLAIRPGSGTAAPHAHAELRLEGLIQRAPVASACKGLDGQLLLLNRRAEALAGRSPVATPDPQLGECFSADQVSQARAWNDSVLARGEEAQREESLVLPGIGRRDFLMQGFPLLDAAGRCRGLGVIATDVTDCKHRELARGKRQKLEALGLLAGGIAHDFNNLLAAMKGNLELARLDLCPEGGSAPACASVAEMRACSAAYVQTLENLVGRATHQVAQVLAYAGGGKSQVQTLDLNSQVEEMTRILQASLSRRVTLRLDTTPGLPPTEGDPTQINQIIMNLVLNAAEAMEPQGGAITLRTGLATLTREDLEDRYQRQAMEPGAHLVLEVADTGPGIPPELQEVIFEPFFTTKFTGRGLGLSAVQGILRSHQGGLRVFSEAGKGTTFSILLPAAAGARAAGRAPVPASGTFQGSGTVLVVDDEAPLRQVAVAALRRMGFDTVEAGDGFEAMQAFEANRDRVVLILMDLAMPRMGGEEAYLNLRRAGATVPILLSSGFGQEDSLRRFRGKLLAGYLQKPYTFQALAAAVRGVLGAGEDCAGASAARKPIAWVPEFETGHPVIDAQHQEILGAFNQVVAATEAGSGEVLEALAHLIELTVAHFRMEEALMANADAVGLNDHRQVHARLTRQLQELAGKLSRGETALGPPIFDFMEEWLLCHIHFEDMDLVRWLKAGGAQVQPGDLSPGASCAGDSGP